MNVNFLFPQPVEKEKKGKVKTLVSYPAEHNLKKTDCILSGDNHSREFLSTFTSSIQYDCHSPQFQ